MSIAESHELKPGIYRDMSFTDYLELPFVNNSSLSLIARSPRTYHRRPKIEETPAMRLGTLTHAGKLEPSAVFRRYVVMPDFTKDVKKKDGGECSNPRATKEYKAKVEQFRLDNWEKIIVTEDEFAALVEMVTQLDRHSKAREWFSDEGETELTIVWDDPLTGLRCKGRIDKLCRRLKIIADLKTTADCRKFRNVIFDRGYHRQAAFYIDGWKALTGETFRFGIAAQENSEPYGTQAATLCERSIELGREAYQRALIDLRNSQVTGLWADYESPDEWTPPSWADVEEPVELSFGGEVVRL
ncbi:MAG: PD-(D/E)XK nuclease-like domain-containing protein [Pirellulales bacterium]